MDEYVVLFLKKPFWRGVVSAIGPSLTLYILCKIRLHRWGQSLYARGLCVRLFDFIFGTRPDVFGHPNFLPHLIYHYDRDIVPLKAQNLNIILRLTRMILIAMRVKFAWNIALGTGHTAPEVDSAIRWLSEHKEVRGALISRPGNYLPAAIELYGPHFWFAKSHYLVYDLLLPLIAASPQLRFDCGQSRAKWQLKSDGSYDVPPQGQTYFYEISKPENLAQYGRYYALRQRTANRMPLYEGLKISPQLRAFLASNDIGMNDKLALIHMKVSTVNATAISSDPNFYLPSIKWLQEYGYKVIFVGREPFPNVFGELGVANYSESDAACFKHDFQIFSLASFVITAGSGISWMPDCMGKPYVYADSWHIGMAQPSPYCITLPALVKERSTGRLLSYKEQLALYFDRSDSGGERFPAHTHEGRNADPEEMLEAVKESLRLYENRVPMSAMQKQYYDMLPDATRPYLQSRASEFFLQKHADLMPNTEILQREAG